MWLCIQLRLRGIINTLLADFPCQITVNQAGLEQSFPSRAA